MKSLYINTCSQNIIIKFLKNNKILREESIGGQKNNSQFIMPLIKKILADETPESIIVVIGPGSFTGVRLGVTIAKTFAFVKNIPIRTITTLEEIAISTKGTEKLVSIKENNGYFVGHFDKHNILMEDYSYYSNQEYEEFLKNNVIKNNKLDYKKIIKHALKKETVNPHTIKPAYVKVIEALK